MAPKINAVKEKQLAVSTLSNEVSMSQRRSEAKASQRQDSMTTRNTKTF